MEDDYLARIRANPDDDALREVYADWLSERGDPYGEFIALQFRQARGQASRDDERRIAELLRLHRDAWIWPLHRAISFTENPFEKGFLTTVHLGKVSTPQKLLREIVGDDLWSTVRTLHPSATMPTYVDTVIHPVMKSLRTLGLDDDDVQPICDAVVPWQARTLALRCWAFVEERLGRISDAPQFGTLKDLTVRTAGASSEALGRVLCAEVARRVDKLTLPLWSHALHLPDVAATISSSLTAIPELAVELADFVCAGRIVDGARSEVHLLIRSTSAPSLDRLREFLRLLAGSGFRSGTIGHEPGRQPTSRSRALVDDASKLAGFPLLAV